MRNSASPPVATRRWPAAHPVSAGKRPRVHLACITILTILAAYGAYALVLRVTR